MGHDDVVQGDHVTRFFRPEVTAAWRASGVAELSRLADVALAQLPTPGVLATADDTHALVQRAAWNEYLAAAESIGMFRGRHGSQLRGSLTLRMARPLVEQDVHAFRGAMAECIAAWWLVTELKLPVSPHPPGAGGKVLEMQIDTHPAIGVEVKAPFRRMRYGGGGVFMSDPDEVDHMGAVVMALTDANHKFDPTKPNLTVVVPYLDWPVHAAVLRAFEEQPLTSTSAVMIIHTRTDHVNEDDGARLLMTHGCTVLKNRHAALEIPSDLWNGWSELVGPQSDSWSEPTRLTGSPKPFIWAVAVKLPGHHIGIA